MIWASLVAQMGKESACNGGDTGSILDPGRSSGEGNGNQLQYFFFVNFFYFSFEQTLLYRILLFSIKPQHESAIGIYIYPLPFEPPSHPTPLV